jgi:hypothetical protein
MKKSIFFFSFFLIIGFCAAAQEAEISIGKTSGPDYAVRSNLKKTKKRDGSASPGETLYLDIRIRNTGSNDIRGLRAELKCDDRRINEMHIMLEKSQVTIGDLAAGSSTTLSSPTELLYSAGLNQVFCFSLDKRCSDEPIPFTIIFRDNSGKEWSDTLYIPVILPEGDLSKSIGNFSFFLTTRIMEDGSIQEGGLGWNYAGAFSANLRVRMTTVEKNEEFEDADDSLNAVKQKIYEVFLLPFEYAPVRTSLVKLWLGVGGYYYNEALNEKGFFNMPELEDLGKERVNSYTNEFSLQTLGPALDAGFSFRGSQWFKVSLSAGAVPVFLTWAEQKVSIVPLLSPDNADYSQNHWGSPYLYAELNGTISLPRLGRTSGPSNWMIWFSMLYDYSRLQYEALDFKFDGSDFSWYAPERTAVSQSLKIEGALLIPFGGMHLQIGGGRMFDSITVDSDSALRHDKNYLNISGKIISY